jgi:OPA family glycerol-3-phosphate transporter-like MFS transporter
MSTSSLSETASTDEASDRRLRRTQWTVLLATMFSYLTFYTGRQTFGFAAAPGA